MRKILKLGSAYFVYEIFFVTMIFVVLFLLASHSIPEKTQENCDTLTGSCVSMNIDK